MTALALQLALRFAALLDQRRYDDLADVLAAECVYEFRGGTIQGAQGIIQTYRTSTEWGFEVFDRTEFESEIFPVSEDSARVRFTDHLFLGDAGHRHVCEQVVTVNDEGRIMRIEHVDLPGETDALNAFMKSCGVTRPN